MNKLKQTMIEILEAAVIRDPNREKREQKVEHIRQSMNPEFTGDRKREQRR